MSDFRTNIRIAIEALVKVGYNKSDALDLIWRDSPRLFLKFFTDEDTCGYYRINVNDPVTVNIYDELADKLSSLGVVVNRDEYSYLLPNKKIETIKFVRALTGWGLKAAKDFVEGMTKPLNAGQYGYLKSMFDVQLVREPDYKVSLGEIFDNTCR